MENLKSTTTAFTVLQFSLETGRDGQPTQRTKSCGVFSSVEEAFVSARLLAGREWSRQQRLVLEKNGAQPVEMLDTEWGYDIRQGHLVVTRFWVHERQPAIPAQ
ncbi:MAG TPA: hypothetical protein PKX00_20030 [Opitutaceae bacterium]|jgi:hypothetical protein|nr:hypothetical protein [Opitutaceae bacterium]HRE07917.1 hypothetical protein [Opitutaceae bacterium]